jgi:hypothetical protein
MLTSRAYEDLRETMLDLFYRGGESSQANINSCPMESCGGPAR